MKKVIAFTLLLVSALTLSACDFLVEDKEENCETNPELPECEVIPECEKDNSCEENNMKLNGIELVSSDTISGELIEFKLLTEGIEGNPYDSDNVDIRMTFKQGNTEITVPAFWYQDYTYNFDENYIGNPGGVAGYANPDETQPQGLEAVFPTGDPHFRVRVNLPEMGNWDYVVKLYSKGQEQDSLTGFIPVNYESVDYKGFISLTDNRYFSFDNDETFIPIGQNNAWYTSSTRKTKDYEVWFSEMNQAGMNASRVWMATWGFALEWGDGPLLDYTNRQNQAYRLDKVMDYADEYNIYFLLTILNHGQFSATTNAEWQDNPWNEDNGGILSHPALFFSDENAKQIFKEQLRYIVARWGYSDNVLAWELFNEVDWIDNYSDYNGKVWHDEMAEYLKSIDPNHLVTSSVKGHENFLFTSDQLDFINSHDYGYAYKNISQHLPSNQYSISSNYDKPIWFSEIGVNWENGNATYSADPDGIALHQQTWVGALGGGLGGAMNWWWDSYVDPYDMYDIFKGASIYLNEVDLSGTEFDHLKDLNTTVSSSYATMIGYRVDDRVYGYVFHKDFSHLDPNPPALNDVEISVELADGTYELTIYDTVTGDIVKTESVTASNGTVSFTINRIVNDAAYIIK